jgi:hypothetical protein
MYGSAMQTISRLPALARRTLVIVGLAGLLAAVLVEPVSASSVRRTWTAHVGNRGVNGTAVLQGYMDGPGSIHLQLIGLQPSTDYPVVIYRGPCSSPQVIARMPSAVSDATGAVSRTSAILSRVMDKIWSFGRSGPIAVKVGVGPSGRCGALTYPVATRIAMPSLKIDLPVVKGPSGYPFCNVAMYYPTLSQPREGGVSFLYAHARVGMFLPLLERSKINNGASLLGATILVWTSDDLVSTYRIFRVRRHVTTFAGAFGATTEQLWIQTSEGPHGTRQKLIVMARRTGSAPSAHAIAHPAPHPVACR